jgi:iron complex outermembrane receptor protein
MNKLYIRSLLPFLIFVLGSAHLMAQSTSVAGTVKDVGGAPLPGVNIIVKGRVIGTITDTKGQYNLTVNQAPPFTLVFSFIGFKSQEVEIKDANTPTLDISMEEQTLLGQEVVVSASRVEESILRSPVTIEKLDVLAIRQTAAPDYFDALQNVKGVQASSGSLNFTAINTRGFATIANTRMVQLVDGVDTQAPVLNFPTGTIMGLSELDAESIELVPGASSALYGPNAFNGIMIMKSKSPFEYPGLSMQVKGGVTSSQGGGTNPMMQYAIRYAKAFNNRFAFKVNFSYMKATDWLGSDYKTDRVNPEATVDQSKNQNFDGLNLYGDETQINTGVPSIGYVTRTGFREQDILDNRDAKTIKADAAIHYRLTDKLEAIYAYRFGGGSSIYQGTEKYALRDFTQQFHRIELKSDNFWVRAYMTQTDAGKSYNLSALGGYANEAYNPSAPSPGVNGWVTEYVLAMQGYIPGVAAGNPDAARGFADRNRPAVGSQAFNDLMNGLRANYFQKPTAAYPNGGASFIDNSRMYHAEFNYNFADQIKFADVQIGGNYRQYDLFSNGTIFNEAPSDGINFQRIKVNQYGAYTQVAKTIADALKITASIRYDKSDNFEGRITPRVAGVYTINENHNLRASYQTGFRNPDMQAQYIYFPSSGGTILGGTEDNASRYGIYNGGAYTKTSYDAFRASKDASGVSGSLDKTTGTPVGGNPSLLVTQNVGYVKPERLTAYEIGYKGLFGGGKMLIDLNAYWTTYNDFLSGQIVALKNPTTHQGKAVDPGTLYSLHSNATETINASGVGLGLSYNLPRNFVLSGNYNYATFTPPANQSPDFIAGFNTPTNKYNIGLANRKVAKNLGFNINFRYQDGFLWQSSYGQWNVPKFGVLDAQVSYKVSSIKTMVKLGGTNIGGGDYRTNLGAPYVGQTYYISLTFDEFLK